LLIVAALNQLSASPEKKEQNNAHKEKHDSSGPQEPTALTAVSSYDYAARQREKHD
jgi:hypothetical protein